MSQHPDPHRAQQSARPRPLRPEGARRSEIAPIELFFDLVYVFAIIQVSHTLLAHLDWVGAVQVAVLFGAVWWAWTYSAWAMNWLNPHSGLVRVLNGLLMLAALGMSVALPHAFAEKGLLFAACYVGSQVSRAAFAAVALRGHVLAKNFTNLLAWNVSAGVLWFAGAFLEPGPRLVLWLAGLVVDVAAPRFDYRFPALGLRPCTRGPPIPHTSRNATAGCSSSRSASPF